MCSSCDSNCVSESCSTTTGECSECKTNHHPNPDELKSQRETDKEHGYPLASVKSIVRHRNKNKRP